VRTGFVKAPDRVIPAAAGPGPAGGAQGTRLVRPGLLADAAVDPLAEQIGVAEVAGILLDHVE
jgi:hypothetical protein